MADRVTRESEGITNERALYMALELGHRKWQIRFGDGERTRDVTMPARDLERLREEIGKAKRRFGLGEDVAVRSCYEAGWDGFWLHRFLVSQGVENVVVDSASIEVNRRYRRAKTDRLDAGKLLVLRIRHARGERVWSVVRVPGEEAEDVRQIGREVERLKKEMRQHRNRIEALLVTQGIVERAGRGLGEHLEAIRRWDGSPLPEHVKAAVRRELGRLELCRVHLREVERRQEEMVEEGSRVGMRKVAALAELRAIGKTGSWVLGTEVFGWRQFGNRRELAASVGVTPMPYRSGSRVREQGISKAGNRRVRRLLVELAWGWLRFQPESRLSVWYRERFASGGPRMRRIGIVALARRLLIALWRYVEHGAIPEGAELKRA